MATRIFLLMLSMVLFSCGKHADGTSVWSGGLWILPILTVFGTCYFGYKTFVSSKSGSTQQNRQGSRDVEGNTINKGYLVFTLICLVATIGIIWWVNAEK